MAKSCLKRDINDLLVETYYFPLKCQSNVYGLATVESVQGPVAVLVSPVHGKVVCLRYEGDKVTANDVQFTYIPVDADIVSIDAFNRCCQGNSVVIGITFVKLVNGKPQSYLNIYSEGDSGLSFDIDNIAQECINLALTYTPYQLKHVDAVFEDSIETVLLLSGSDKKVHLYREDKEKESYSEEMNLSHVFPELCGLKYIVTSMDIQYFDHFHDRLTVLGCLCGTVLLFHVNTSSNEIKMFRQVDHDNLITSVQFFTLTKTTLPQNADDDFFTVSLPDYHVLVTSAVAVSVVYMSVLAYGLDEPRLLLDSDKHDAVLCGCVLDINLDGENELILGTYGQKLLVYKFMTERPYLPLSPETSSPYTTPQADCPGPLFSPSKLPPQEQFFDLSERSSTDTGVQPTSTRSHSPETESLGMVEKLQEMSLAEGSKLMDEPSELAGSGSPLVLDDFRFGGQDTSGFYKMSEREMGDPVHAMDFVTGQGFEKLVIITLKGIHVLQRDPRLVTEQSVP